MRSMLVRNFLEAKHGQMLSDQRRSADLVVAQLRVLMDVAAPGDHFRRQLGRGLIDIVVICLCVGQHRRQCQNARMPSQSFQLTLQTHARS